MTSDNRPPSRKTISPFMSTELARQLREQQSAMEKLAEALRPHSQFQEQMRQMSKLFDGHRAIVESLPRAFTAANSLPLAGFDLKAMGLVNSGLDMRKISRAMGLSPTARLDWSRALNPKLFDSSFAREMARFQNDLAGMTRSSVASAFVKQLQTPQITALSDALRDSVLALRPFGDAFLRMAEEERTAKFILELGFVPHDELWDHITADSEEDAEPAEERAAKIALACWPQLHEQLALDPSGCLNDGKLSALYQQMLTAHDRGDYEIVLTGLPTALERSVRIAVPPGSPRRVFDWISEDVAELPMPMVGGLRGFRVWRVLVDHTFASFSSDQDADLIKFPNRHVVAHGAGSKPADVVQSLNAILLTHFVIRLAAAAIDYRKSDAA